MKEIIIVRHGQAEHNLKGLTGGWTNLPLTETGKDQAYHTGKRLFEILNEKKYDFYSSDLIRASETAEIIGKVIYKQPTLSRELRDLNNGDAANCSKEEANKLQLPIKEPLIDWVPYPNAESWLMMHKRIALFMTDLDNFNSDTILLISHANPICSIIHWWLELTEDFISRISFEIDYCSIAKLTINKWSEKTISKLNDTSHLLG